MRPLITALRTLTRIPVPGSETTVLTDALPFFPVVGLLIGLLVVGVLHLVSLGGWTHGAGIVAMSAAVWITRGLHVDGLADVSDSLGGARARERRLEIMKDPHTGAFGVMAIVCDLFIKAAALSQLAQLNRWMLAILPFVVSRLALVLLAVSLPYARTGGGKAACFVETARPIHFVLAALAALAICTAMGGLTGVILLLQGLILSILLRIWMQHEFGGITGDLLGLSNEVVETGLLVVAAVLASAAT